MRKLIFILSLFAGSSAFGQVNLRTYGSAGTTNTMLGKWYFNAHPTLTETDDLHLIDWKVLKDTAAALRAAMPTGGGGGGSSQWTTTGSDIYYNTGNVAIGATSSSYQLRVNSNSSTANGILLNNSGVGASMIGFNGMANAAAANPSIYSDNNYLVLNSKAGSPLYLNFDNANSASTVNIFNGAAIFKQTGGLGVGVSPSFPLHVKKDQNAATQAVLENATSAANAQAYYKVTSNAGDVLFGMNSTTTSAFGAITTGASFIYSNVPAGMAFVVDNASAEMRFANAGNTTRVTLKTTGTLDYAADYSSSYTSRSLVDKAWVLANVGSASYAGEEVVRVTTQNYTVPTTLKIYNIIYDYTTAGGGTFTLPTGSGADKLVLYISNSTSNTITFSQNVYSNSTTWTTSLEASAKMKLVYSNTDSKWYMIMN